MKKKLLTYLFAFLLFNVFTINGIFAQQETEIKCKMSLTEIMQQQQFDIDNPKAKKAETITQVLLKELNLFYQERNESISIETDKHKDAVLSCIKSAKIIGMDYTMFLEDINIVESTPRFAKRQVKSKTQNH